MITAFFAQLTQLKRQCYSCSAESQAGTAWKSGFNPIFGPQSVVVEIFCDKNAINWVSSESLFSLFPFAHWLLKVTSRIQSRLPIKMKLLGSRHWANFSGSNSFSHFFFHIFTGQLAEHGDFWGTLIGQLKSIARLFLPYLCIFKLI